MTHLKRERDASSSIDVTPAAVRDGVLETEVVHLATIGLPPLNATPKQDGRFQKSYQGGTAIISVIADRQYSFGTTHLVVDLWATRPDFNAPGKLPAIVHGARAAIDAAGSAALGPVDATWAFRTGTVPPVSFFFRTWFATVPAAAGRPLFAGDPSARLSSADLDTLVSPRWEAWEVNGFPAYVMFRIGCYEQRMTPTAARELAAVITNNLSAAPEGENAMPIPFLGTTVAMSPTQASEIARFLNSSAGYAEAPHSHK